MHNKNKMVPMVLYFAMCSFQKIIPIFFLRCFRLCILLFLILNITVFSLASPGSLSTGARPIIVNINPIGWNAAALYPDIPPGAFSDIRQEFRPNVVELQPNALMSITQDNYGLLRIPGITPKHGRIYADETSKMAVRADTVFFDGFWQLRPLEIHEVFTDFEIPEQTVPLTIGNIANPVVAPSLISFGNESVGQTIEFLFQDKILSVAGATIKLNGKIALNSMSITGRYTMNNGYDFALSSGEQIDLEITSSIKIDKEVMIPITGFSIPCGFADLTAGLYLIARVDGNFTLGIVFSQGLNASVGVRGGTKLYIPTGISPYFEQTRYFNIDTEFGGKINGHLGLAPVIRLRLVGKTIFWAELFFGAALDVKEVTVDSDQLLDVSIFGLVAPKVEIVGRNVRLPRLQEMLYQAYKAKTGDYRMEITDACAYRGLVAGKVKKMEGVTETPYGNKEITIIRKNGLTNQETSHVAKTDSQGNFHASIPLFKHGEKPDQVQIKIGNTAGIWMDAKIPFFGIDLEYADFFQDRVNGVVLGRSGISFNGNVRIVHGIDSSGTFVEQGHLNTTSNASSFWHEHDFKPGHFAFAMININGFILESPLVPTDADIAIWRVPLVYDLLTDNLGDPGYISYTEQNEFNLSNQRGLKKVHQPGNMEMWFEPPLWPGGIQVAFIDGISKQVLCSKQFPIVPRPATVIPHGNSSGNITCRYRWGNWQNLGDNLPCDYTDTASYPLITHYATRWKFFFTHEGHIFSYTDNDEGRGYQDPLDTLHVTDPLTQLFIDLIDSRINPFYTVDNRLNRTEIAGLLDDDLNIVLNNLKYRGEPLHLVVALRRANNPQDPNGIYWVLTEAEQTRQKPSRRPMGSLDDNLHITIPDILYKDSFLGLRVKLNYVGMLDGANHFWKLGIAENVR